MRHALLAPILLVLLSCADGVGPGEVTGTWAEPITIPGNAFVLVLTQHAGTITGTGSWSGEACCSGTMEVAGTYTPQLGGPRVALSLHYNDGTVRSYVGTVEDASHIAGKLGSRDLPLVRQ